jgi:hypothetical protein
MRNFLQLQQFRPGDSRIDTAPVQNALEAYGNKTMQFGQIERQNEAQQYQRGRDTKQDARQDEAFKQQNLERLGKSAFAFSQLPPEQRDPQTWGKIVKGMQSFDPSIGSEPDDLDPIQGPAKFAAVYGGQVRDPREDKLMDLKVSQAQRDLAQPAGGTETFFGSPQYERDKAGATKAFIIGNRGSKKYIDAGDGATLLGPGGIAYDKAANTVLGREGAEKRMALPKVETALKMQEVSDRVVVEDIDRALKMSENPWATGFTGNLSNYIANTPGSNLSRMLDGIQANIGFDKLQDMRNNSPTGGALGAVTERELALLQSVFGSLTNSQSQEELQFNLNRLKQIRQEYSALRRQAYESDVARFGAANVPSPETGAGGVQQPANDPKAALKQKYGVDLE